MTEPPGSTRPYAPRLRPSHVLGDKGYSSRAIRTWLRRRGIAHTIPERAGQKRNRARRGSRGGRPPRFDRQLYRRRNVVEPCSNRLKQWRGIATRYDKTSESYQAAVTFASLLRFASVRPCPVGAPGSAAQFAAPAWRRNPKKQWPYGLGATYVRLHG